MKSKNRLLYKPPPLEDYSKNFCKLYIVIAISFVFISAEFVGGYISGSLSVISDAFHLVTDLIGFAISFGFIYFSRMDPTQKMTFGFHRMEVLGALGNLFIIWFLAIFLIYEATDRIIKKQFVAEPLAMLIVGIGGLAINIVMYFVLHSGSHSHGLMSESCDHHHQPHDNDPNPSNCTTSFCNQLVCDDQDCLKQVSYSHCHTKNPQGESKIHIHDQNRKLSDELDGKKQQNVQNSLNQLNQLNKNKGCQKNCKHDHQHEKQFNHQNNHQCNHSSENEHKHDQNCKHHHSLSPEKQTKNQIKLDKKQHKHGQNCKHEHQKDAKIQLEEVHKHSQNCKHEHSNKQKHHKHDHQHDHEHDHKHDHKHDGHDHSHHDHKNEHEHSHADQHQSISMKAAVLHALSDVIQSIGLLISSLFIFFLGSDKGSQVHEWNDWHYLDPIATYIFSVIVIISTFPIVKSCYYVIMESTPSTEVARQIKKQFLQAVGVVDVHDLHIWSLRPGKNLLIAHVFAKQGAERQVLTSLTQICRRRKIFHSTLQVEQQNFKNHDTYILCDHDIH